MKQFALQQYQNMQQDLASCSKKGLDEEQEIECCFQICTTYWRLLQQKLSAHQFKIEKDEIDFFKNVKPLFISQIEYYNLLYHAQLFKPVMDDEEQKKFWCREALRLERFVENNSEFLYYISSNHTHLDQVYFLRKYNHSTGNNDVHNNTEKNIATTHDRILSEMLALKKYTAFVQSQLEKLITARKISG